MSTLGGLPLRRLPDAVPLQPMMRLNFLDKTVHELETQVSSLT